MLFMPLLDGFDSLITDTLPTKNQLDFENSQKWPMKLEKINI